MFACFQVLNLIRLNFKSSFKSLKFSRFYLQTSTQRKDKAEVQKRRFLHTVSSRQFHCGGGGEWRKAQVHDPTLEPADPSRRHWGAMKWVTGVSHSPPPHRKVPSCVACSAQEQKHGDRTCKTKRPLHESSERQMQDSVRSPMFAGGPKGDAPPPPLTFSNHFFLSFIQNTMSLRKGVKESWWGQEDQTAGLETPHHRYFFTCVVFACMLYKCVSYLLLLLKETCGFNGFLMMIKSVSPECPERGQNQINFHFTPFSQSSLSLFTEVSSEEKKLSNKHILIQQQFSCGFKSLLLNL